MLDRAGEATPAPTRPPLPVSGSLEYPEDYDPLAESANFWVTGTHQARHNILYRSSVPDPRHFGVDPDPDPRIHASD
jgi:hypothetical protein